MRSPLRFSGAVTVLPSSLKRACGLPLMVMISAPGGMGLVYGWRTRGGTGQAPFLHGRAGAGGQAPVASARPKDVVLGPELGGRFQVGGRSAHARLRTARAAVSRYFQEPGKPCPPGARWAVLKPTHPVGRLPAGGTDAAGRGCC